MQIFIFANPPYSPGPTIIQQRKHEGIKSKSLQNAKEWQVAKSKGVAMTASCPYLPTFPCFSDLSPAGHWFLSLFDIFRLQFVAFFAVGQLSCLLPNIFLHFSSLPFLANAHLWPQLTFTFGSNKWVILSTSLNVIVWESLGDVYYYKHCYKQ